MAMRSFLARMDTTATVPDCFLSPKAAAWFEGQPCPHKPCFDYCRFSEPHCMTGNAETAVIPKILDWLELLKCPEQSGPTSAHSDHNS